MRISKEDFVLKGGKYLTRYFNLPHSNRTALTFFVFDTVDAMHATAYLFFLYVIVTNN